MGKRKKQIRLVTSTPVPVDLCVIFVQHVHVPPCVYVLHRGRASGGEDEKAGSEVRPSPPCASN